MEAGPLDRRDEGHPGEYPHIGAAPPREDDGLGTTAGGTDRPPGTFGDDDPPGIDGLLGTVGTGGLLGTGGVPATGPPEAADTDPSTGRPVPDEHELRPARRLRLWQTAPIVGLGVLGSLMFAFPLAFGFGEQGAVVAMLGLLLTAASAGWGIMVARQVGYTWPGVPARGSGGRPDWRFVALYGLACVLVAVLAIWRVARLH